MLLFVEAWDVNHKESLKPGPHLVLLTQSVQANNQVEAYVKVGRVIHDILVDLDGLAEFLEFNEGQPHILLNFEFHLFILLHSWVQGHVVHLDGLFEFFLLEIYVTHINS